MEPEHLAEDKVIIRLFALPVKAMASASYRLPALPDLWYNENRER
jgi:hypothetical protein